MEEAIASYWDTHLWNDNEDILQSRAEVAINRITIKGGIHGGAYECQKCPMGTVSQALTYSCMPCIPGSQPNEKQSECSPCKEGFYNQNERDKCKRCPPFTHSARHPEDPPVFVEKGKPATRTQAATHCEMDTEFHVR